MSVKWLILVRPRQQLRRNESGAVAIMVAVLAVVLLSIAALGVDLGNAMNRKQLTQNSADFAAVAGGEDMPDATPLALQRVADMLNENQTSSDGAGCNPSEGSIVTPFILTDTVKENGEVTFSANNTRMHVLSPAARVQFGLANVMGFEDTCVQSEATVEVKSPLMKTLPFYAFPPCDYGLQTIVQPVNGKAANAINLQDEGQSNPAELTTLVTNPATAPAQVPLNVADPDDSLTINSSTSLAGTTDVGFFLSGGSVTGPAPVTIGSGQFDINGTQITIPDLPTGVTSVGAVWYVRVKIGGFWSAVFTGPPGNPDLRALPLTVGNPTLTCDQGSSDGNFGTIDLPPTPTPAGINGNKEPIAYNIIEGLSNALAPVKPSEQTADFLCTSNPPPPGTKLWNADGTNCVKSETGVDKDAAEWGFLTGFGTYKPGLIADTDSERFCPFNSPSGTTHTAVYRGLNINNDVLTCFFTEDDVKVSDVSSSTYTRSGPVIDASIYDSPRFVSVPIFGTQGNKGTSARYQIIGFRPGFITDQPANATRINASIPTVQGTENTGSFNGIAYDSGKFNSLSVVFLNDAALPDPPLDPDGNYVPYLGTGDKAVFLVN